MKGNSIRKTLPRLTKIMIVVLILLLLPANMCFQLYLDHHQKLESSRQMFEHVKQVMEMNEADLQEERQNHSKVCIQKAEMAAYFVKYAPSVISDLEQTRELAAKLEIDEIHFFTADGELYAGTRPECYGFTFSSGPQIEFFLPMLQNTSLKLCQGIEPNTAEGKEMQYAAVWLKDQSGIVQVGLRPERLLEKMQEKNLQQLIAAIPFDDQGYLHILDTNQNRIVASSSPQFVGREISEFGTSVQRSAFPEKNVNITCDGEEFCTYTEPYKNYLLVRAYLTKHTFYDIAISTILLLSYILFAAIGVIGVIIWYINKHISKNLTMLNKELKKVEEGNLNGIVLNTGILEFDELILEINQILKSIELGWGRLSNLIDTSRIPLGIFEYNEFYKKAFVNEWMLKILDIEETTDLSQAAVKKLVCNKLKQAESCCVDPKEEIYQYSSNGDTVYIRIQKHKDEQSITYYVVDVSEWWKELHILRDESNRDTMTGLYNRRGMGQRLDQLFSDAKALGRAAVVMLDADGLKRINDMYGHQAGDEYLKAIGEALTSVPEEHSVCVRLGGDEFLLFLYGYQTYQQVDEGLALVRAKRGTAFRCDQLHEEQETVEFSMGYVYYPAEGEDYHSLMHLADERMYQDKKERKASRV